MRRSRAQRQAERYCPICGLFGLFPNATGILYRLCGRHIDWHIRNQVRMAQKYIEAIGKRARGEELMQTGFIEAADSRHHASERKQYWDEQVRTLGYAEDYEVKIHLVRSAPKANGARYAYYAVFIEAKASLEYKNPPCPCRARRT